MCGISGIYNTSQRAQGEQLQDSIRRMASTLVHRGPDNCSIWVDEQKGVALGHNRLSIVDLSTEGRQPMHSDCKRYTVVFNGEIYNHRDIRKKLEVIGQAPVWRGHSDTEVLLAAVSHWGIEVAVKQFNGMFAFAVWDRKDRTLYLVRDRIGEKPLYYGWAGESLVFASELKAIRAYSDKQWDIDEEALALYLSYGYIPAPQSIYRGIWKLEPGTIARIDVGSSVASKINIKRYWSAKEIAVQGMRKPYLGNERRPCRSWKNCCAMPLQE